MPESRWIEVEEVDGVTVVWFQNIRVCGDSDARGLEQELLDLVGEGGGTKTLLTFSRVGVISTSLVAAVAKLDERLSACGGTLKLSNIGPATLQAFTVSGLDQTFDVYNDAPAALAAF